jgi:threonine synthase
MGVKLKELIYLAKERGLGWYVKTFPRTFGEFLEYIAGKYDVDVEVEVEYRDKERLIYTLIPASAFRVKPPLRLEESVKAMREAVALLIPASQEVKELSPVHYLFAMYMSIASPAGAFEERTLNNRLCYAKYLNADTVVVACQ